KMNISMFYPVLKFMEKMLYKQSDKIVINNEGFRYYLKKMVKNKPVLFLPNAFAKNEVEFKEPPDEFRVIYTGNIGFAQSYEKLQEMAHQLEENKINFKIIGYGMNAHLFQSYIEYKDFKYVTFEEEKTREECLAEIRHSNSQLSILKDSAILLNVLPAKVIGGIASRVPVVTNLGGYTSNLIKSHDVGYAKVKATSEELTEAIKTIKSDNELESRLRKNSKKLLKSHFLWETNIEKLDDFIFDKEFK